MRYNMKRVYILLSLVAIGFTALAQEAGTHHYINLYGKAGWAAMLDGIGAYGKTVDAASLGKYDMSNKSLFGGPGAGLGLGYELQAGHFLFNVGVEAEWLNSTSKYAFGVSRDMIDPYNLTYIYRFYDWRETRNTVYASVPVMLGAQFGNFYFLAGAKVGYGIMGFYKNYGDYDVVAYDPALAGEIGGNSHGLGLHHVEKGTPGYNGKLSLKQPDVRGMLEIGLDLDQWLQAPADRRRNNRGGQRGRRPKYEPFGRHDVHYRVALFTEYGFMNTNAGAASQPLAYADSKSVEPSGSNSVLSDNKMNNLFAGIKFTVQFEVGKKINYPAPAQPSYFILNIVDENGEPTNAKVQVFNESKQRATIQGREIKKGRMAKSYPKGSYIMRIQKGDYYADSVSFVIADAGTVDSATVQLRPLPKIEEVIETPKPVVVVGQTFILHNMNFATNKVTILPSSEGALKTLYDIMQAIPTCHIKIIGHTDNVGTDEFNQRLSEGRAKAIRDELINRGIAGDRIEAEGRGESEPMADNDTEEGRAQNRRVEIEILKL